MQSLNISKEENHFINNTDNNSNWILKPCYENRGQGIEVIQNIEKFKKTLKNNKSHSKFLVTKHYTDTHLIQKYLDNPLLIQNKKFDIRCYVIIMSTRPFIVLYHEGYIRRTLINYEKPNQNGKQANNLTHLTNQAIQYQHPDYNSYKEETVWETYRLYEYLQKQKQIPDQQILLLQIKIKQLLKYVMYAGLQNLIKMQNTYEILGCDIMIDEQLNPYLIEMNTNPALDCSTQAQCNVIPKVLRQTLDLSLKIQKLGFEKTFESFANETMNIGQFEYLLNQAKGLNPEKIVKETDDLFANKKEFKQFQKYSQKTIDLEILQKQDQEKFDLSFKNFKKKLNSINKEQNEKLFKKKKSMFIKQDNTHYIKRSQHNFVKTLDGNYKQSEQYQEKTLSTQQSQDSFSIDKSFQKSIIFSQTTHNSTQNSNRKSFSYLQNYMKTPDNSQNPFQLQNCPKLNQHQVDNLKRILKFKLLTRKEKVKQYFEKISENKEIRVKDFKDAFAVAKMDFRYDEINQILKYICNYNSKTGKFNPEKIFDPFTEMKINHIEINKNLDPNFKKSISAFYLVAKVIVEENIDLQTAYENCDIDDDGKISKQDLIQSFDKMQLKYSENEINDIFDLVDQDKDNYLNFNEFEQALKRSKYYQLHSKKNNIYNLPKKENIAQIASRGIRPVVNNFVQQSQNKNNNKLQNNNNNNQCNLNINKNDNQDTQNQYNLIIKKYNKIFKSIGKVIKTEKITIKQAFEIMDIDHDGFINSKDLEISLSSMKYKISQNDSQQIIKELDLKNQGFLDFKQFENIINQQ